ncbi:MAG: hypothetical protein OEY86_07860 [Nitrospira sp.]|nr:hypothetical protein [Nitrospira sp.]
MQTVGRFFLQAIGIPDEEISEAEALLVGALLLVLLLALVGLIANLIGAT